MIPKFNVKVVGGRLIESTQFNDHVRTLFNGDYFLTIKPAKEREIRSNQQNKYYWSVPLKLFSEYTGYSVEECHELCKYKLLLTYHIINTKHGPNEIKLVKSTTMLNTVEFEEYLSKLREWLSIEFGVYVPTPNEVSYE